MFTQAQLTDIPNILSQPRFTTYLQNCNNDRDQALRLYQWNLQISSAFLIPLHILEITIRNAVVEALEKSYTQNWPWNNNFIYSLPSPSNRYSQRKELLNVASQQPTMGKVVAELKFVFWEKMFLQSHDTRIWHSQIKYIFPNSPNTMNAFQLRKSIHDGICGIRELRNRIAHHEPIFQRNLSNDFADMHKIISWRNATVADWMNNLQSVQSLIQAKP